MNIGTLLFAGVVLWLSLGVAKEVAAKQEDMTSKRFAYIIAPVIVGLFLWHALTVGPPLP